MVNASCDSPATANPVMHPHSLMDRNSAATGWRRRWAVVLSGGSGQRMQPMITDWLGVDRPKQYCTFVGGRSMLQHTLDRACSVASPKNVLTIIGQGHQRHLSAALRRRLPGRLIEQPRDAGTAAGVFLTATYVLLNDPEATIILFPADHFVHPEKAFCQLAGRAADLADLHPDRIVLVGAVPDGPETDYGWIGPDRDSKPASARAAMMGAVNVAAFTEKPGPAEAQMYWRSGYLWNTMVTAVRVKTLWELGRRHVPEMMSNFDALLMVLRAVRQGLFKPGCKAEVLERLYEHLEPADFSRDIIQPAAERCLLLPMQGIDWSDWGRPERVTETLAKVGREPLFARRPMESAGGMLQPVTVG